MHGIYLDGQASRGGAAVDPGSGVQGVLGVPGVLSNAVSDIIPCNMLETSGSTCGMTVTAAAANPVAMASAEREQLAVWAFALVAAAMAAMAVMAA